MDARLDNISHVSNTNPEYGGGCLCVYKSGESAIRKITLMQEKSNQLLLV